MSKIELSSRTIGKIWRLLEEKTDSVSKIKQYLIEAGTDIKEVMGIKEFLKKKRMHLFEKLAFPTKAAYLALDPNNIYYRSKNEFISEAFKIIYGKYNKSEADGILIELTRLIIKDNPKLSEEESVQELKGLLEYDKIPLEEILETTQIVDMLKVTKNVTKSAGIESAENKIDTCMRRLSTDLEGAVTVAGSAVEDVCIEVFKSLSIKIPKKKQLPYYLVELRRKTNLENLATIPDHTKKIVTPLSTLAENIYNASHEAGDRHGSIIGASQFVKELLVVSCAALIIVIAGALKRGELKLKDTE